MIRFRTTDWCPTDCRTPAASYITIEAKITEIAKNTEPKPSVIATAVANALTIAEWALGMPPLLTKKLRSIPLPCIRAVSNFINWANTQAQRGIIKTQLVIRS
jgi:hypothetical protein